jgi:hypothetical protein
MRGTALKSRFILESPDAESAKPAGSFERKQRLGCGMDLFFFVRNEIRPLLQNARLPAPSFASDLGNDASMRLETLISWSSANVPGSVLDGGSVSLGGGSRCYARAAVGAYGRRSAAPA